MRAAFLEVIDFLESAFRVLEGRVPQPKWVDVHGALQARYSEQTLEQALVQKLARVISGLRALDVLLNAGLAQEQGVMKRVLDELHEDILFLSCGRIKDEWTSRHDDYLSNFWAEEFDDTDPLKSSQKRAQVPRKNIRAANARALADSDPHTAAEIERTLYHAYSGYIHAASSAVMEMCGGKNPKFFFDVPLTDAYTKTLVHDAWNYFYRSLISVGLIAKLFADDQLGVETYRTMFDFERKTGRKYSE